MENSGTGTVETQKTTTVKTDRAPIKETLMDAKTK